MKDTKIYCQIYEDGFSSTTTNQRCVQQCPTCKNAKENIKIFKKGKNKIKNKRYYLHSIIKKQGCSFNARKKVIYVPFNQEDFTKQVLRLRDEFGYSIQTEII